MTASRKNYESMSDEELETLQNELDEKRRAAVEEIRAEQLAVRQVQNQRAAEARAKQLLEGLSPGERDVVIKAAAMEAKVGK